MRETIRDYIIIAWLAHSLIFQTYGLMRQSYIDAANKAIADAQQQAQSLKQQLDAERAKKPPEEKK